MYPNQGYPGQFPPYGAGMPQPGMPQPFGAGMAQPFGAGMPMPQPGISQPAMPNYGIPGYGPPEAQSYGQAPAMPSYGSPNPAPYGQPNPAPYGQPNPAPYGQPNPAPYGQPNPAPYGQPAATPAFGSAPPMQQNFGQPAMSNYSQQSPPSVYPQIPNQQGGYQGGNYGMPPQQEQMVQAHQYTASYSQPTQAVRRGRPVITPNPNFDAANDAAALRKAMKGFGTDEDGLINVLCRRTCDERVQIARAFKTAYGKDLVDDLRSETSGNFQKVMVALTMPKNEYYCRELFEAMNGAGTDEDVLIEVMCTMSNQEIREIGFMYQRMYGVTLESQLRSDTSGSMKRLMTSLSVGGRDESMRTDINSARADAESLKRAGVGRWGTDESEFNRVLCLRNYEQLKLVCQEYEKLTGNSLEKDIKREFSGDIEDALLAIVRVANNRPEFFARRLHKSMAGLGTNDRDLIRLCVTRSEIDMVDVKEEFQRYYSKSLKSFIKGDTSGHYKHALYALCGENRS